ncbi:class I SAM-dependent methyltransferase [Streptosporangium sp. NPDC002544]|uniref:class I SAM-dependent methyltransferase n=1 Tax=Streptosporangium sp. NPDC002544 TaxID=3154538 RepID=UPI00331ACEDE
MVKQIIGGQMALPSETEIPPVPVPQAKVSDFLDWREHEVPRAATLLGLRRYWMSTLYPRLAERYAEAAGDPEPRSFEAAREVIDALPGRDRFLWMDRYIHLRIWEEVGRMADERLAERPDLLDEREDDLGSLTVPEGFQAPAYYTGYDFHRQDGGIWRDDRGALVYALGARLVHAGRRAPSALHDALTAAIPEDLAPRRVIDVGCGFGKTTFSLARRYPDAQVSGVDLSLPVLRLGRKMATEEGLAVDWVQADAEALPGPEGSADLVVVSMVLHEMPLSSIEGAMREARRVLRPGGVFVALETRLIGDPFRDVLGAYHSEITGEPYINAFRAREFGSFARAAGFDDVTVRGFAPPGAPEKVDRHIWSTPWALLTARK